MAWIQVHQQLKDHRKLLAAADELEIEPAHMLGLLISFWLWALDNAPSGDLDGISDRMIARAAQWNGQPSDFVGAMERAGLLDRGDDGALAIHDWYEYAGRLIDKRDAERDRSRRRRTAASDQRTDRGPTGGRPPDDRRTTAGQTADGPQDDRETTEGRVDKTRVEKSREEYSREDNEGTPSGAEGSADPTPYEEIGKLYHSICLSYPRLRAIEGTRRKQLAARWKKYKSLDAFRELFEKAEASDFMKGENEKGWAANFDWMIKPSNMAKVLEGRYDNDRPGQRQQGRATGGRADTMEVLSGIIAAEEGGARA